MYVRTYIMHTVHVNTYILHRSACSEKLHRFYHRRLSLPPKKKIHDSTTYSNLRIRKTETNLFVTFSINGIVLFTCSAGGASARKKNRRRRLAANSIGSRFAGFMRYMSKRGRSHIFRNIIIVLHCPVSFLRSFMQGYRYAVYKYRKQQVTNWLREFVHLR